MLIIFDLDDTLLDTWQRMIPKLQWVLDQLVAQGVLSSSQGLFEDLVARNTVAASASEALSAVLPAEHVPLALQLYYEPADRELPISPIPGALKVLSELGAHTLVLVSKGNAQEQYQKMEQAGIDKNIFQEIHIVDSYDKRKIYEQILSSSGVASHEVVVVGDKATDLLPAKGLGIHTIHMRWGRGLRQGVVPADFSIDTLHQLPTLVEVLQCKQLC